MTSKRLLVVWLAGVCAATAFRVHSEYEGNYVDLYDERGGVADPRMHIIFPGTKWCGTGSIAANYSDLGPARATDMCCRQHDYCDDVIEAGQTAHNLTNHSFYTRLNCRCDNTFYSCLKDSSDRVSDAVGNVYFNVLCTQCFQFDFPIVKCLKHHFLTRRCLQYQLDETAPKLWQWFDVSIY